MSRTASLLTFAAALTFAPAAAAGGPETATLELGLPASAAPPPYAPGRVSKLEIDGKDYSTPRSTRRSVVLPVRQDAAAVTVVYTYWPTIYMRVVRTKRVRVERGKLVKASLAKADEEFPDKMWVIYVPTPPAVVEAMCKLAKVGKDDVVYDVGCGDGRLVIHAVKQWGAQKGVGIDLVPELVQQCRLNARAAGVGDKVTFLEKDALAVKDFSEASVVLLYLSNPLNEALRPALRKTLKPGARVVSHRFVMGDWKPDKTVTLQARDNRGRPRTFKLHLWTVPR
jgi:SAM-dependent methyltransferase